MIEAKTDGPTAHEIRDRAKVLRSLEASGYELFPLKVGAKTPRDVGWQLISYQGFDWTRWLGGGGNVGVRARPCDLFIDVDPRNGGLQSMEDLKIYLGIDLDSLPCVDSGRGDGGHHIYATVPVDARLRSKLPGFDGIDFKKFGGYVVAPGSLHPSTGAPYVLHGSSTIKPTPAPKDLVAILTKPPRPPRTGDGGQISCDQLAALLGALDPSDYGQGGRYHEEWLDLAMACHDGTNGEGLAEWLQWCAGDPSYGEEAGSANEARWDSFEAGDPVGITVKTLYRAVVRAGHPALVARLDSAADDFAEEADGPLVYQAEEADGPLVYEEEEA